MRLLHSFAGSPVAILAGWAVLILPWQAVPVPAQPRAFTLAPSRRMACNAPAPNGRARPIAAAAEDEPTSGELVVVGSKHLGGASIINLSGHKVGDPCTVAVLTEIRDKLVKSGNFGMHHAEQQVAFAESTAGPGKVRLELRLVSKKKDKSHPDGDKDKLRALVRLPQMSLVANFGYVHNKGYVLSCGAPEPEDSLESIKTKLHGDASDAQVYFELGNY